MAFHAHPKTEYRDAPPSRLAALLHHGRLTLLRAVVIRVREAEQIRGASRRLARQRGVRHRTGSSLKQPVLLGGSPPWSYVDRNPNSPRRLSLRRWLRPSLPLSLRGQGGARGSYPPPQAGLRACCLADIPTPLPNHNKTKEVYVMFSLNLNLNSASLALDACANTSALVRQRFSVTGSALPSQHLAVNRSLPWGSA